MPVFDALPVPLADAAPVGAAQGSLLLLGEGGELLLFDPLTGATVPRARVDLPALPDREHRGTSFFPALRHRLHAGATGRYAAVVVDTGSTGRVVDTVDGRVTMELSGGDYHPETVPFGLCFVRRAGRDLVVHRTDWNRLDVSDAATGEPLTARQLPEPPDDDDPRDLDYFHGGLSVSPDGTRIADDGWVWQPVAMLRSWSLDAWLTGNPWESESGPTVTDAVLRDDWNTPLCWVDGSRMAVSGLDHWDAEEFETVGHGAGVRILDVTTEDRAADLLIPMSRPVTWLGCHDGVLYAGHDDVTTGWDPATGDRVRELPGPSPTHLDPRAAALITVSRDRVVVRPLES